MLDALNEQNKDKILRGELAAIEYDRAAIDEVVRANAEEQRKQKQNEGACKES